jgi:hypothetical protein
MTPAARVQARAIELLAAGQLGVATDNQSYPDRVLVGYAVPGAAVVLQIPAKDWNWPEFAKLLGFELQALLPRGPDIEELRRQHVRRR